MDSPFKLEVTPEKRFQIVLNDKPFGTSRNVCLEFEFNEDEDGTVLYISHISKCGDSTPLTREMIKMIETMAKSKPDPPWSLVKYIKLDDGSSNTCMYGGH